MNSFEHRELGPPHPDADPPCRAVAPPPFVGISAERCLRTRLTGILIAAACGSLISIAAWLRPDPSGMGTHRQLGLPPCSFIYTTGLPCPTCGMTTAFAWMVHGHPINSLIAQPLGAVLCLATIAGALIGIWMLATGRRVQIDWYRVSPGGMMFCLAAAFFLAWGAKIGYGLLTGTLPQHP